MKLCFSCHNQFAVPQEDLDFLKKIHPDLLEPLMCPQCRERLRLSWKNERNLYKRKCDLCDQSTIAIFSEDKPYTVYCKDCWWSDKWDPMFYGMNFDFLKPFFEQFGVLLKRVPKQALHHNNNENSDYTTSTTGNRNCYLISSAGKNEDCYYGFLMKGNNDCVDNTHIIESQLCYDSIDSKGGYNLKYCQNTYDCTDSAFLFDCRGCKNCFFSCGLRNKQYVCANWQLTREEYEKKLAEISFDSYSVIEKLRSDFMAYSRDYPHLYYDGQNNENVSCSNYIFNSKKCYFCFDSYDLEDCKYCSWFNESKDCQDVYAFGYGNELCYSCLEVGTNAVHLMFCLHCWNAVNDLAYCFACHSSRNLFGCVGLKHKEYCIFNKQYSKVDYERLVGCIIAHMKSIGEWGKFPPSHLSPFSYNETIAQDFYPLSRKEALASGFNWHERKDEKPLADKTVPADQLPDRTSQIPDEILNWAVVCGASGRPFRILPQELKFYRKQNLPIPRLHPDERHKRRLSLRNPRVFVKRPCDKCGANIETNYQLGDKTKVYCEKCYLGEVY